MVIDDSIRNDKLIFNVNTSIDFLNKFSSYSKLQKVTAYILRWKNHKLSKFSSILFSLSELQTAEISNEIMAPFPRVRVTPSRAFTTTSVDYAGPVLTKAQNIRTTKTFKSYIAVFVCMSTKAVHLELVSSLSSEAFKAALRRFVGRRGKPHTLYSDRGTNFIGADNELRRLVKSYENDKDLSSLLLSQSIQ